MAKAEKLITENLDLWASTVKSRSSAGRGSKKKPEIYGIAKLRKLILDLAIRGMLVPQNPEDQSADELINAVKKTLPNKKSLNPFLREISKEVFSETNYKLPHGWAWISMGNIGIWATGCGFPKHLQGDIGKEFLFCKVSDMNLEGNEVEIKTTASTIDQYTLAKVKGKVNPIGTIIFPKIGGAIATHKRRIICKPTLIDNNCSGIQPIGLTENRWLLLLMQSLDLTKFQSGTSVPAVSQSNLDPIRIGIPPLLEQKRIVNKANELMALCDQLEKEQDNNLKTHETLVSTLLNALTSAATDAPRFADAWQRIQDTFDILFKTERSVDQLKQSILQLAVMGKLVPQDPEDESAATLLNKVADERDKLAKKQKRLKAIPADAEPYKIPESWKWCQLGELSISSDSGWSPQCDSSTRENDGQWGVLKVSAVSWGEFRANEHKKLPDGIQPRPEFEVRNGDFLLSRANTEDLVARSVVVDQAAPRLMMSDKIVRIILASYISKNYINLANGSIFSREYYKQNSSGTSSSMKNVSRETMAKLPIPLPPLAEQNRIVAKVDELMALCDQLKASISSAQETQLNLADSIVEQAIHSPA